MAVKNAEDDDNLDENEEQEEKENVGSASADIACLLWMVFSHPPKRRRVTYASTIRPVSASASASTLSISSMKPLHRISSYCTCILV